MGYQRLLSIFGYGFTFCFFFSSLSFKRVSLGYRLMAIEEEDKRVSGNEMQISQEGSGNGVDRGLV